MTTLYDKQESMSYNDRLRNITNSVHSPLPYHSNFLFFYDDWKIRGLNIFSSITNQYKNKQNNFNIFALLRLITIKQSLTLLPVTDKLKHIKSY